MRIEVDCTQEKTTMRIRHRFSRRPLVTFLFAAMSLAVPVAAFADGSCRAVHAAYQKMFSDSTSQNAKNSGTVNVTKAVSYTHLTLPTTERV